MGLFRRLFEKRGADAVTITAEDSLAQMLAGIEITKENAEEIPAISACIDFISSVISALPVKLYRDELDGSTEEVTDDIRTMLLNDDTGDILDPVQMKKAVIRDFYLNGAGFIYPEMNGNEFVSLRYIDPTKVSKVRLSVDPIYKYAEFVLCNGRILREDELIRVLRNTKDGVSGISIVQQHQQLLSAMYRQIVFEKSITASGGKKRGFLQSEFKMTDEQMETLRRKWEELYGGTDTGMVVLNKGLSFNPISNTGLEMQLQESKTRNNELACQIFCLSAAAVSGKVTPDEFVSAIRCSTMPVIAALEAAFNKGLLLPSEKKNCYYVFDTSELLKGDILKRYQAYQIALRENFMQPDEIRYKEDMKPLGMNWIKFNLRDVLYDPKTNRIYVPNMNQYMEMGQAATQVVQTDEKPVDKPDESGIIEERKYIQNPDTGLMEGSTSDGGGESSTSGALNPDSKKAREHADRYYESVRHMTNDVNRIASNTGFSVEEISTIKDFVFMQKHELDGKIERFAPSFEMSQSWQRLIDGKNIQPHDITLLKHELMERELMKKGFSQDEAHIRTSQKYNYAREAAEYYDKIDSDNKS